MTLALAALALVPAMAQQKQNRQIPEQLRMERGVGPVMSASTDVSALPEKAQSFLRELFPNATVAQVKNDFRDRQFDVDMSNGYEVTFDYAGNWQEVDAPAGATLPSSTLTALVPEEVVLTTFGSDALLNGGITNVVDEIMITPYGYAVEYMTGTVGKAKANVNKTDGSIMLKANKANKARMNNRARKAKNQGQAMKQSARKGARPVRMDKSLKTEAARAASLNVQ